METILLFLNGYDKNIINNKKAIAVLTINTAIAFLLFLLSGFGSH